MKCVKGIEHDTKLPSGSFVILPQDKRQLYLIALPDDAIREVYLGVRTPIIDRSEFDSVASEVHEHHPNARLLHCVVGEREWTLESKEIGGDKGARRK